KSSGGSRRPNGPDARLRFLAGGGSREAEYESPCWFLWFPERGSLRFLTTDPERRASFGGLLSHFVAHRDHQYVSAFGNHWIQIQADRSRYVVLRIKGLVRIVGRRWLREHLLPIFAQDGQSVFDGIAVLLAVPVSGDIE